MYYYYRAEDATLLYNLNESKHYDTEHFYPKLDSEIWKEQTYIEQHLKPFERDQKMNHFIDGEINYDLHEYFTHLLANLYLHETEVEELKEIQNAIRIYIDKNTYLGIETLKSLLPSFKTTTSTMSHYYLDKARDIVLSLGHDVAKNNYHTTTLKKTIKNDAPQGSFTVWVKVLNYIRLAVYEKRRIDIESVTYFLLMYNNRKDITVINIYEALKTFENKGLLSIKESVDIIVRTQKMSEKGIRHLLTDYIMVHNPEIISIILKHYHPDNLIITWFDLSPKFIDCFSDKLFNYALFDQLLKWFSYHKEIDFRDIEKVLNSNRKDDFLKTINSLKYRIRITKDCSYVQELRKNQCLLVIDEREDNEPRKTAEARYNQGILDSDSIEFIKANNLDIGDISGYANGYYSVLADLDIYSAYSADHVKENIYKILQNVIIGKIGSINMFAQLFHLVGNVPKLMSDYDIEVDYRMLFNSFLRFLNLSLINPNIKKE